jgi:hypothetical protein
MTVYYADKEFPGQPFTLYDSDHVTVVPLVTGGWTGKVEIIRVDNEHLVVTQTTDIVLSNTAPNFTRTKWAAATLAAIVADMGTETTVEYKEHPVITVGGADEGIGTGDPVIHTFKKVPV